MQIKGSTSEIVINVRWVSLFLIVHGLLEFNKFHLGSEKYVIFLNFLLDFINKNVMLLLDCHYHCD